MNYPLISEYIEGIKSAEDSFEELSYLRPVLGDDGLPVMTSDGFVVIFKMKDEQSGTYSFSAIARKGRMKSRIHALFYVFRYYSPRPGAVVMTVVICISFLFTPKSESLRHFLPRYYLLLYHIHNSSLPS
jgi:hypothetical protein